MFVTVAGCSTIVSTIVNVRLSLGRTVVETVAGCSAIVSTISGI